MKAIVTGGEGGLGRAIRARLADEGYDEVESLDLTTGFDVTDPGAWGNVGHVDLACLNAGVLTGETDIRTPATAVTNPLTPAKPGGMPGLRDTHSISAIVVDPKNPDIVYAASMGHMFAANPKRGVFLRSLSDIMM